ncbi:hypothetical protein H2200_011296 [Cladophialophora chaetospira]|uniref:Uncharacterized protein n=1 Tax=Cladophialophora chaetospira TaxID=386627 RepID=A0AA39CDL7_9EURO|nr:hypothetical protein H2200_011296 [Cladophialophora chaetospira]
MVHPDADSSPATSLNPAGSGSSHLEANQALSGNHNSNPNTSFNARRLSTEEDELAKAIANSLRDQTLETRAPTSNLPQQAQAVVEQSTALILSLNNAFDALDDPEGDTAIYIGVPSQGPDQTGRDYQFVRNHFDRVHVVKSQTLRLMGEESRFTDQDLLNHKKSIRAQTSLRRKHASVLEQAEKKRGANFRFKYYIDLRPPDEGDEAVLLVTELTCTRGILTWHLAAGKYGLSALDVLGHDEYGTKLRWRAESHVPDAFTVTDDSTTGSRATDSDSNQRSSAKDPLSPQPSPEPKLAAEYTPLRHHGALERLLQAIKGNDPKLDSAPKVWTFFAIARYFGCAAHERISGWITTWLYAGANANFIQNNPEIAYRIAMSIRSPDLLKDSFSILVGERALIEAYGEYRPEILNPLRQNVHGRKLELLDDDERNRIDHAASSLVKRIREVTASMCREMDFLHKCPTYQALEAIVCENPEEIDLLKLAKKAVKEFVRSRIYYVLCQEQNPMDCHEKDLLSTAPFRSATTNDSFANVYMSLNQPMRLFTNTFWIALQRTQFDIGYSNLDNFGTIGNRNDNQYIEGLKELYKTDPTNGITYMTRSTLHAKISAVSRMLYERNVAKGKWKEDFEELPSLDEKFKFVPEYETLESDGFSSQMEGPWLPTQASLTAGNPARSSISRSSDEACSPTKRRKTSEADEFVDPLHEASASTTSHDFPTTAKKVSFGSTSALEQALADHIVPAGNKQTTSATEGGPPLQDQATAFQQSSYGNPTSGKPSWRSRESVSSLHQVNTAPTVDLARHSLAMRPKLTTVDARGFSQTPVIYKEVPNGRPRSIVNPYYVPESGALDSSGTTSEQSAVAKGQPLVEAEKITEDPADQSDGWLSAPKKFFNPWTGKWDLWGSKRSDLNVTDIHADAATSAPQKPFHFASGSGTRVVKQAFSNSNTPGPGQLDGTFASKETRPDVPADLASIRYNPINTDKLLNEVSQAVGKICSGIVYPPHLFHQTGLLPTNLFDTLLCLNENEWRYLPLWCPDGNDDGTGGVFDETPVPNLDPASANIESFGPGRIRRGYQDADSVMSGSDIEEINSSQAISTVGKASKLATDGTHTVTSFSSAASVVDGAGDADTVIVESPDDALSIIQLGEDARGVNSDADPTLSDLEKELDDDEDTDTINGDDPLEKEMSASLQAFITGTADQTTDKGKAKAQNFPHGVSDPEFERERRDLPFRGGSAQTAPTPTGHFSTMSQGKAPLEGLEDEDEEYEFL